MSARAKSDICSCCGNEAKTSKSYCGHLKQAMGQYIPKFNVRPTFFDISDVANPADRIAHHLQYMFAEGAELSKSASAEFPFSDMLAERAGVSLPETDDRLLGCAHRGSMKPLEKLASAESYFARRMAYLREATSARLSLLIRKSSTLSATRGS